MKKTFLFVGLLASVMLFASCNKDDVELLRHPFRVQGELSPSFGLPVISSTQLNLNELLSQLGDFNGLITDDNVVTFHYDTSFRQTIEIGGMVSKNARCAKATRTELGTKHLSTKYAAPFISRDTVIEYPPIPINLFDNMPEILDAGMSIGEMLLTLSAHVSGECPDNVNETLKNYVSARVDNLTIKYVGHDNQEKTFDEFATQALVLNDIVQGGDLHFDSVNMAEIINSLPHSITAGFRLHVEVDSGLLYDNVYNILQDTSQITSFSSLLDSLQMTSLTFGADIDVKLPFEVRIGGLPKSFPMPLQGNGATAESGSMFDKLESILNSLLDEGAVSIDSSKVAVVLEFANGIPLDLTLGGVLLDANDNEIYPLFANQKVASAVTAPMEGHPGVVEAVEARRSTVELELTVGALEKFTQASKLRLDMLIATDNSATDQNYRVIKRDDFLKVWMMVKLDPSINIDTEIFGGLGPIIDKIPFIGN